MANVTEKQYKVLRAILTNYYTPLNGDIGTAEQHVGGGVWSRLINDAREPSGMEGRTLSGVCGTLVQAGYATTNGTGKEQTIALTQAGYEAATAAITPTVMNPAEIACCVRVATDLGIGTMADFEGKLVDDQWHEILMAEIDPKTLGPFGPAISHMTVTVFAGQNADGTAAYLRYEYRYTHTDGGSNGKTVNIWTGRGEPVV